LVMALAGMPEHIGAVLSHVTVAACASSTNLTLPPAAIVILLVGSAFGADPSVVQHAHVFTSQLSLTSSFTSGGADWPAVASAGTIATAAPSTAAMGR
jgi:hypothetical protein